MEQSISLKPFWWRICHHCQVLSCFVTTTLWDLHAFISRQKILILSTAEKTMETTWWVLSCDQTSLMKRTHFSPNISVSISAESLEFYIFSWYVCAVHVYKWLGLESRCCQNISLLSTDFKLFKTRHVLMFSFSYRYSLTKTFEKVFKKMKWCNKKMICLCSWFFVCVFFTN